MKPLWATAAALTLLGSVTGCQPSADTLKRATERKPGVLTVDAHDNGGEDDLPFTSLPWVVTVRMESDATEGQIRDVAHAYEDDMKDGDVEGLTIEVGDRGHLEMGVTTGRTDPWVGALADGLSDPDVASIVVEAWIPGPSISLTLRPTGFHTLYGVVREYQSKYDLADLDVESGAFSFSSSANHSAEGPPMAEARLRIAFAVDRRFRLVAARVWGTAPLRLEVRPGTDLAAVRALVAQMPDATGIGRVVITDDDRIELTGPRNASRAAARALIGQYRHSPMFRFGRFRDGEVQIGTDDVPSATYMGYGGETGEPDPTALPFRYVIARGDFGGRSGLMPTYCLPDRLELQTQWTRFSVTQSGDGARVRVMARDDLSPRAAGRALAKLCDGRLFTVVWPNGSRVVATRSTTDGGPALPDVATATSQRLRAELLAGWNAGLPST